MLMEAITARPKFNPNSLRTSKLPSGVVPNIPKGSLVTKTFQTELVARRTLQNFFQKTF